jgi:hypothetical protein
MVIRKRTYMINGGGLYMNKFCNRLILSQFWEVSFAKMLIIVKMRNYNCKWQIVAYIYKMYSCIIKIF